MKNHNQKLRLTLPNVLIPCKVDTLGGIYLIVLPPSYLALFVADSLHFSTNTLVVNPYKL